MKNSHILSAAFLGVFGTVCFIGGFFTGEYATYDEKVIKEIYSLTQIEKEKLRDVLEFGSQIHQLKILNEISKTSTFKDYINGHYKGLSASTATWKERLNSNEYKAYSKYIEKYIGQAQILLNDKNTHNK